MTMTMQTFGCLDVAVVVGTNCVGTVVDADVGVFLDCQADSFVHDYSLRLAPVGLLTLPIVM